MAAASTRPHDSSAAGGFSRRTRVTALLALALFLTTCWTFAPALRNGFVNFDDQEYVVGNTHVQAGLNWENVRWAFRTTWAGNWHPLTWLSHMADCQMFGLHPWGHHLTSLLLHAANGVLLFLVLARMTGSIWRAFLVAAIFALHPLRVESVAWASERKDVLSGLFWFLAIGAYARYAECLKAKNKASRPYYAAALVCCALGLMAKPSVVTLPFVLLLLDYWPLERVLTPKLVVEKVPFFALAAASCVVTFVAQRGEGAVATIAHLSLGMRLENAVVSYARYLGKMFWPADLSIFYPMPDRWNAGMVFLAALLLAGVTIAVVLAGRRRRHLPVGWFWFVGTLVPVIGLVQVGAQSMADRYTYIPGVGVLLMLAWSLPEWAGSRRALTAACGAAAILVLSAAARRQVGFWKDSESLFRRALAVSGDNYGARVDLGNALWSGHRLDEAIAQFREAVRLRPELRLPHERLGAALRANGKLDEAIAQLDEILKLNPNDATAQNEIGAMLFDAGRLEEAIAHYREAARLEPGAAATHYNLGIALSFEGRWEDASAELAKAAALEPANARTRYNLGVALLRTGRPEDAARELRAALALDPASAKTHYQLGLALGRTGHPDEAKAQFRAALQLQPTHAEAARALEKLSTSH